MWYLPFTKVFTWIIDPKNRNLLIFLGIVVFMLLFLQQCNRVKSLKEELSAKDAEITRVEQNQAASVDSITQSYDSKTGTLTATIKGYEVTMKELDGKYSEIFSNMKEMKKFWKDQKPSSIVENNFYTTENITNMQVSSSKIDSAGNGDISFIADTIFSPGNSRKITGNIPYTLSLFNKNDSSLVNYKNQPYYATTATGKTSLTFDQQMTIYTGLSRDKKTKQTTVWAKTNYPGVTFNVLKGANIQDDDATKKALVSSRKEWGLGFSFGAAGVYNLSNKNIVPGVYFGVGLNYTPKKLQFGK